jgi:hypothetical protein
MAGKTIRELAEHLVFMRFAVAVRAGRQMPMTGMTKSASNLPMTTASATPAFKDRPMTGAAGSGVLIALQGDMQRLMGGVTLQTGAFLLPLQMWLMALGTGRTLSMLLAVAIATRQIGMGARRLPQSPVDRLMAIPAEITQDLRRREQEGRMGILVAIKARHYFVTMRQRRMALAAVRHQLVIIVPSWIVGMEYLMAILTSETMPATLLPQTGKMRQVTASTFCRCHRCRQSGVDVFLLFGALVTGSNDGARAEKEGQDCPKPESSHN